MVGLRISIDMVENDADNEEPFVTKGTINYEIM